MSSDYNLQSTGSQIKLCKDIIRCVNFAAIKHRDMRQKDEHQAPYINHLIDVAYILINEGGISDVSVIQAALLHSTLEDTNTSFYELHAEFGEDIAGLVKELTVEKSLSKPEKRRRQLETVSVLSPRAKLVILAKHLNIMRDIRRGTLVWSLEEVEEYLEWARLHVTSLKRTNAAIEASLAALFLERGITLF